MYVLYLSKMNYLNCLECQLPFVAISSYDMTFWFSDSFWVAVLLLLLLLLFLDALSLSVYVYLVYQFLPIPYLAPWSSLSRTFSHISVLGVQPGRGKGVLQTLFPSQRMAAPRVRRTLERTLIPTHRPNSSLRLYQAARLTVLPRLLSLDRETEPSLCFHSLGGSSPPTNGALWAPVTLPLRFEIPCVYLGA